MRRGCKSLGPLLSRFPEQFPATSAMFAGGGDGIKREKATAVVRPQLLP
jgi:hypothetical protein